MKSNKLLIRVLSLLLLASTTLSIWADEIVNLNGRVSSATTVNLSRGIWRLTPTNPSIDPEAIYTAWSAWSTAHLWLNGVRYIVNGGSPEFMGSGTRYPTPQEAFSDPENKAVTVHLATAGTISFSILDSTYSDNHGGISIRIEKMGPCVLDFAERPANYQGYPAYFNLDGFYEHSEDESFEVGTVERFLSCYHRSKKWCESSIGTQRRDENGEIVGTVTSAHWYEWARDCKELEQTGILPEEVKLLATDVNLKAIRNGNGVDLELTVSSQKDTAMLMILGGQKLDNEGTKLMVISGCEFTPNSEGEGAYSCSGPLQDNYRVVEFEDDGDMIVYKEVAPQ